MLRSIAVFCGSSMGFDPIYRQSASAVGRALARNGIELVYGGGKVGLMGVLADSVLAEGGVVTGVVPKALVERELAHGGLSKLHIVPSMQLRKALMADLADAFVALPGGGGTLDEIIEQWTWAQLGIHLKPCAFLDVNQFYAPLQTMLSQFVAEGFTPRERADMLIFSCHIDDILERFRGYVPPRKKWSDKSSE